MEENRNIEPRGPWKAFAIAGFASGIVALALFFIPYLGIGIGINGIVLSALGKRSVINRGKATAGLVMSIIATVISFIALILFFTVWYSQLIQMFKNNYSY